jgi:hypothetical protein
MHRKVGRGFGIAGGFGGILRIATGRVSRALRLPDSRLRPVIHVMNPPVVVRRLAIQLIGMADQRRCLVIDILFGRAPCRARHGQTSRQTYRYKPVCVHDLVPFPATFLAVRHIRRQSWLFPATSTMHSKGQTFTSFQSDEIERLVPIFGDNLTGSNRVLFTRSGKDCVKQGT